MNGPIKVGTYKHTYLYTHECLEIVQHKLQYLKNDLLNVFPTRHEVGNRSINGNIELAA